MLWRGFGGCRTPSPRSLQGLICLGTGDVEEHPAGFAPGGVKTPLQLDVSFITLIAWPQVVIAESGSV